MSLFGGPSEKKELKARRREADELLHLLRKHRLYQRDTHSEEERTELAEAEHNLHTARRDKTGADLEPALKAARRLRKRHFPPRATDWITENVEVALVAIVIALAIRTYFLQPFKIPTGSMEPTLNGVRLVQYDEAFPSYPAQIWSRFIEGRRYVELKARNRGAIDDLTSGNYLFWFEYTDLYIGGVPHRIWATPQAVYKYLLEEGLLPQHTDALGRRASAGTKVFEPGETVIRAAVDTGDQVLVNKMAYHFGRPQVGDVFVFTTGHIPLLQEDRRSKGLEGSQFYIKRCTGTPGQTLQLQPPRLFIDGAPVLEPPIFEQIYSMENGYEGYVVPTPGDSYYYEAKQYLAPAGQSYTIPDDRYWAMGDNSDSSLDSRYWGGVPRRDLSGTALVVYWPFTSHWGWIR
ncbi:MAG: signal peptidase I [Verrucomicrobiota bacterium]